jgi:hypothetical protein
MACITVHMFRLCPSSSCIGINDNDLKREKCCMACFNEGVRVVFEMGVCDALCLNSMIEFEFRNCGFEMVLYYLE